MDRALGNTFLFRLVDGGRNVTEMLISDMQLIKQPSSSGAIIKKPSASNKRLKLTTVHLLNSLSFGDLVATLNTVASIYCGGLSPCMSWSCAYVLMCGRTPLIEETFLLHHANRPTI